MTPPIREMVLAMALAVAPDQSVSVPARWLLDLLGGEHSAETESVALTRDLTVADLAQHYGRSEVTIRAWLLAGVFPQAYRTPAGWRVPRGALRDVRAKRPKQGLGSAVVRGGPTAPASANGVQGGQPHGC